MKNEYYINEIKVLDIIKEGKNKYFLLDDKSKISIKEKIQTKCHECGELSSYTTYYYNKDNNEYICPKCRGLNHNGFKNKHHTENYKKLSSQRMKGKYLGSNNPMYQKNIKDYMTEEAYNNWLEKHKNTSQGSNNPMYQKNIKDYMTEEAYNNWLEKHRKRYDNMSEYQKNVWKDKIRKADYEWRIRDPEGYKKTKQKAGHKSRIKQGNYKKSKIEIKVEEWLKYNNLDYEYSCIMGFGDNCFQYDFIIHDKRILIEVQGDYWHGNPKLFDEEGSNNKRKLNEIQKIKMEQDKRKKEFAESKNFKILYIWENDINNNNFESLMEIIKNDKIDQNI